MSHDRPADDPPHAPPQGPDPAGVPDEVSATTRLAVERRIGRGGLGDVHVARDTATGRDLAVKFLSAWAVTQEDLRESFQFEATVTSQLEHPNIVPVYATGSTDDDRPFYCMRLIQGRTLGAAIADFHDPHRAHDPAAERTTRYRELLGQFALVCKAIAYAHDRGVIHRDIKPANVMLGRFGEVVVLDWGLASRIDRDDRARHSGEQSIVMPTVALDTAPAVAKRAVSGTPAYMSPEQHDGAAPVGPASDVWGLGATLYHLITGQPPFEGDLGAIREKVLSGAVPAPTRVKRGVSRALEAVCQKAMARHPADRYDTPLDLARDIDAYLADNPVSAWREPLPRRLARWTRRHRTVAQIAVGALALLLLLAGAASVLLRRVAHDEYRSRQTALRMAARLAASAAALQIDSRWRILEHEADDDDLRAALLAAEATPVDGARAPRYGAIQTALDEIAAATRGNVDAESWTVCDAGGVQVARSPRADTIGQDYAWRNYFHGGEQDLEPGTKASPLRQVHRSTVYRSNSTGKLKVAFSAPIWNADHPDEARRVIGVLLMSFDVGLLFRSLDGIGAWNASQAPYSVAVIDLRDDRVEGESHAGLVLENPDVAGSDLAGSPDLQLVRVPDDVVERLRTMVHRHAEFGKPARPTEIDADDGILGLFPGTLREILWKGSKDGGIAAAEPIRIPGRPDPIADVGWAVLVHER